MGRFTIFFACLITVGTVNAQDVHFSQYDLSPLNLNVAETGFFDGDWRVAVNYRQQWKSIAKPFQTTAASYDQNIYQLPGNFSAGISMISDQSGLIGLTNNKAYLSLAYKKAFNTWTFSIGLQPGFAMKSYSLSGTSFPEQFNENMGYFDPNLPLSEQNLNNQTAYFDLNTGILIHKKFAASSVTGGFTIMHFNKPDISYFDSKEILPRRYIAYTRSNFDINESYFARPAVMLSFHSKAQEIMVGGDVGMYFSESVNGMKEAWIGIDTRSGFDRNGDAFIASAGVLYKEFRLGMAYDINYSGLKSVTNNRGAFEISVIYISPSTAIKRITIPCDRY